MIYFQLAVFILFYLSLVIIIICMYCRYRKECKFMKENEDSQTNFNMLKRLMQVVQKQSMRNEVGDGQVA